MSCDLGTSLSVNLDLVRALPQGLPRVRREILLSRLFYAIDLYMQLAFSVALTVDNILRELLLAIPMALMS